MDFEQDTQLYTPLYTFLTIAQNPQINLIPNLPWPYFGDFSKAFDVISHDIILTKKYIRNTRYSKSMV